MMMLKAPTFIDKTGYFPERNIETVFSQFNESLRLLRGKLGEPLYLRPTDMSDRMRAHFEADPEGRAVDTRKGRAIIREMEDLLKQRVRKG